MVPVLDGSRRVLDSPRIVLDVPGWFSGGSG